MNDLFKTLSTYTLEIQDIDEGLLTIENHYILDLLYQEKLKKIEEINEILKWETIH